MKLSVLFLSAVLFSSTLARGADGSDPENLPADPVVERTGPCAFLEKNSIRERNCLTILSRKLIANEKAFTYTMEYLRDNSGRLADSSCLPETVGFMPKTVTIKKKKKTIVKTVVTGKPGEEGVTVDTLKNGIQNKCVFFLNDVGASKGHPQAQGYLVDLCATDEKKVVTKITTNKGTGTGAGNAKFTDVEGKKTTLVGAFITAPQVHDFIPFKMSGGYKKIKKKEGRIRGLRLFGLNSSNNDTYQGKPMHASPYNTSWGCPSVRGEDSWIMDKLVEGGPALVMNYGPESYHQSTTVCENEGDGEPGKKSGDGKTTGGQK
ncbi:MAG TPA: hypothetical protein PL182_03335 [Pseudobdellovibrionaceae bacterium]|nr:hypothetical protein [Pseudobdellovibrionaceae bacterium]